ncbi:helix-turn-helix domain-containing protein [Desulfolithobacter sp.]
MCVKKNTQLLDVKEKFIDIWERIKKETELKTLTQLGKVVESTQQYVSRKKKANDFPIKWAYLVAKKYGLSTEWIMTGKGPKRLDQQPTRANYENNFLELVDEWLTELIRKQPRRAEWFRYQFEDSFPGFKEWLKQREAKGQGEGNTNMDSKVA